MTNPPAAPLSGTHALTDADVRAILYRASTCPACYRILEGIENAAGNRYHLALGLPSPAAQRAHVRTHAPAAAGIFGGARK